MALTRADAHQLVDALDVADVPTAVALLRQLARGRPVREFRGFDSFDGDEDLAARSAEILRVELGGTTEPGDGRSQPA
jgi:hypothetical protein